MGARLALAGALLLLSIAMGADALACGPRGRHHHHMAQTAMPRGGSPAMLPQPGSHGAQLVGAYCTQCHGTPNPALHYSGDWRSVAERMYGHMQRFSARVYAPTDEEFAAIVAYMEFNAADRRQLP